MKKKITTCSIVQMIGVVLARCSIMNYNPIGIGYFAALYQKGKYRLLTFVLMAASMFFTGNITDTMKYIMVMVTIAMTTRIAEAQEREVSIYTAGLQNFVVVFAYEMLGFFMEGIKGSVTEGIWTAFIVALLSSSISVVFSKGIDGIIKGKFRLMQNEELTGIGIIAAIILYYSGIQHLLSNSATKSILYMAVLLVCLLPGITNRIDKNELKQRENVIKKEGEKRLQLIEESLSKLADSFSEIHRKKSFEDEDYLNICDEITRKMCANCSRRKLCASKTDVQDEIYNLVNKADKNGKLSLQDTSSRFMLNCLTPEMFVSELNHTYEKARLNMIWGNKLIESRQVISMQLKQISKMIGDYGKAVYNTNDYHYSNEEELRGILKRDGIFLKKLIIIERKNKYKEYIITARCQKGTSISSKELAVKLGEIIGVELEPEMNGRKMLGKEITSISFVEKKNFYVLHGMARKTKLESEVSGDNFTFSEIGNGKLLMSIADGMGSGYYAFQDSEMAIELLEQLMDSGFSEEVAIKMINSVMLVNSDSEKPTTLDMGILDLTSGICDFVKLGAASTFVKRGSWVEAIKSTTMPMGVFGQVDIESTSKKMYAGDMIIMVSDGIVEALGCEDKEEAMSKIIMGIDSSNPKEMASSILENVLKCNSNEPEDDMTVLVTGVWNRAA